MAIHIFYALLTARTTNNTSPAILCNDVHSIRCYVISVNCRNNIKSFLNLHVFTGRSPVWSGYQLNSSKRLDRAACTDAVQISLFVVQAVALSPAAPSNGNCSYTRSGARSSVVSQCRGHDNRSLHAIQKLKHLLWTLGPHPKSTTDKDSPSWL